MPSVTQNGASINYVVLEPDQRPAEGDVILVHGLATNLAFWYFQYAVPLAERFRVTVFDLRGHGRSTMTESGYRAEDLAQDLEGLVDHLGIERAHLCAHSFGGVVALQYAVRNPGRVASLVLADTQTTLAREALAGRTWQHGEVLREIFARSGLTLEPQDPFFGYHVLTVIAQMLEEQGAVPKSVACLVSPLLGTQGTRTARLWLRLIRDTHAERELRLPDGLTQQVLSGLEVPILALYGSRSQAFVTRDCLRKLWPHACFQTIDGAGHFFPASHAVETLAACQDFWRAEGSMVVPHPLATSYLAAGDLTAADLVETDLVAADNALELRLRTR